MKRTLFLTGITLIILCSCKQVAKMKYGIHEPREETPSRILAFMKKMDQLSGTSYIFKDSSSYFHYLKNPTFRENLLGSFFFTEKGLLINCKDTAKCRWSVFNFVKDLRSDTTYKIDTAFRYQDLLQYITPLASSVDSSFSEKDFDYIVVITWAMFAGRLNERLFSADEATLENPKARIKVIFLNVDMQESWKIPDRQKIVIR